MRQEVVMIKLINWFTGNEMYVAEDRVQEYLAAGHRIAGSKAEPKKATTESKPKSRKKAAKK